MAISVAPLVGPGKVCVASGQIWHSIVLYQADFHGPSTVHEMSITTQGATDSLFVCTHRSNETEDGSAFILAEPVPTQ
jgi:hypothetical protein